MRNRRFGNRLAEQRAEVPVGDREHPRERVVERLVGRLPVAHRDRAARGPDESVVAARREGDVAVFPGLAWLSRYLAGSRHSECVLQIAVSVRICRCGLSVRSDPEPIGTRPVQHPELVVVRMVLHHQHDDVVDLGDRVRTWRQVRIGQRPWPAQIAAPRIGGSGRVTCGGAPASHSDRRARDQSGLEQAAPARRRIGRAGRTVASASSPTVMSGSCSATNPPGDGTSPSVKHADNDREMYRTRK